MVVNPRDRIKKFLIGVSNFVEKECCTGMLHNYMDISWLIVYVQQLEESKIIEIRQEVKRSRSYDSSYQRLNKRFHTQYSSMGNEDRDPNQHSQGGGNSYERARCPTCGK